MGGMRKFISKSDPHVSAEIGKKSTKQKLTGIRPYILYFNFRIPQIMYYI